MTLLFGAKFDLLISFQFQAKVSQHLKVPLSDSFSDQLHTCLLLELGVSFLLINTTIVTSSARTRGGGRLAEPRGGDPKSRGSEERLFQIPFSNS